MAKSLVERYEQLLAQDPTSSVFVELAKALIAKGEHARAITVCEQGISHHPQSVTGRVLWGKALILMGRPAEAMAQFDQAVTIDKENPHAYNLISEVLLQRGLYRSALPILRKALALQPNDARVRGWMEQAQAALAGGPAPAFGDLGALDVPAEEPAAEEPAAETPAAATDTASEEKTELVAVADAPAAGAQAAPEPEMPLLELAADDEASAPRPVSPPPPPVEAFVTTLEVQLPFDEEAPLVADEEPPAVAAEAAPSGDADEEPAVEAATIEEEGGLLADLPPLTPPPLTPPEPEAAAEASTEESAVPVGARSGDTGARRGLLEGLPEVAAVKSRVPAPAAAPAPKAAVPDMATQVAAYEKELRAKLLPQVSGPWISARALKVIAAVGVVVLACGVLLVVRAKQGGQALIAALDRTALLLQKDTEGSRRDALKLLSQVTSLESDNTRAWALSAEAHALRYAENGDAQERAEALAAIDRPGVRAEQPALALVVDALVADAKSRDSANRALLGANAQSSEIEALAAEVLLARGQSKEALERLSRSLKLSPRNARALVTLGEYYRDAEDPVNALRLFSAATKLAPDHPVARLGVAESQLVLGQDLEQALADVQGLAEDGTVPASEKERLRLVRGRLMTERGKARDARKLLAEGSQGPLARDLLVALGEANRASGDMVAAQSSFEQALKLSPDNEAAKVGLGRTLLDRDREREVLTRVEGEGRHVALVRAAAYTKLGDWKRARLELAHTRVESRYPAEAIVYMARADAAEGEHDRAQVALEKTLAAAKRERAGVRTALALMQWQDKAPDKAGGLLETAMAEDARNYEAACALGRLRLSQGLPDVALKPLNQALERNGSHGEAREALGRSLLFLGKPSEALQQFDTWRLDNPEAAGAHKGAAMALYHTGKTKDAEASSARAVKLASGDPEAHRVRADILFSLGDTKGGFGALESANKLDSKAPETFCAIASAFLRQGLEDNADKAFEAARREGPDTVCGQIGEHWVKDSGGRTAAKALQEITKKALTPWDKAFAQSAMARVLLSAGATKEAREAANEAVRLEPFSGRAHLVLGQVALKQREEAVALQELSRAVELEPADGPAWLSLGDALARQSAETPRAIQAYQTFLKLASASPEAGRVRKALPVLVRRAKTGGR
ncbi:tetratricopeptide repeat protein [Cystobacter fuscus]|uniref:tetratricopeptide repeat protein n=1 Tax=Cystobacter fuscus TaxID=43 RepID=UPI0037BEA03C